MKRLIVNADDFGLTPGINSAVAELNRAAALSSATIMAAAAHFDQAARLALAQPKLAVGCHVVLTNGVPVLPPREVSSLIDPRRPETGRFRPALLSFVRDLLLGRIRAEEIEAEAAAQIRRVQSSGLRVTHLDTHKHTHIFSRVLRPLIRAAQSCGVRAMRNPIEPEWSLRATPNAGRLRRVEVRAMGMIGSRFFRLTREAGIASTDGSIAIAATGRLDPAALQALLAAMPAGTWELVCHPGYRDEALDRAATRLRASREVERQALFSVIPSWRAREPGFDLIDFRQVVFGGGDCYN